MTTFPTQQYSSVHVHTLILWKLMFQFAPTLVGMNLSPSLLGEDNGEPVGARLWRLRVNFCKNNVLIYAFMDIQSRY